MKVRKNYDKIDMFFWVIWYISYLILKFLRKNNQYFSAKTTYLARIYGLSADFEFSDRFANVNLTFEENKFYREKQQKLVGITQFVGRDYWFLGWDKQKLICWIWNLTTGQEIRSSVETGRFLLFAGVRKIIPKRFGSALVRT